MPNHPPANRKFLLILLLSLSFAVILSACATNAETTQDTSAVDASLLVQEISASGEVIPVQWASLSYLNGASDLEILVAEGDQVSKGERLVKSNDYRLEAALNQAQSALQRAQFAYDQTRDSPTRFAIKSADSAYLNARANLIRQEDLDADQSLIDAARADVEAAYANLQATVNGASDQEINAAAYDLKAAEFVVYQAETAFYLKAPFAGRIVDINIHPGEVIGPLQPVLILADLSNFQVVTTDLSEVDVARLKEGQKANIEFDAIPNRTFTGTVEKIADKSSGVSSVYYEVTLILEEIPEALRWGMTAFIIFPVE